MSTCSSAATREEYRLFLVPSERLDVLSERKLRETAEAYGLDPDRALPVYRASRPGATPGEIFDAMATDWFYRVPAIRLAEAVPGSYLYEFAWRSPGYDGKLGACHAAELGFVFDRLHDPSYRPMIGGGPPQQVADAMHGAWVAFAEKGDPGWAPYDPDSRTQRVFGSADGSVSTTVDDLRPQERELWEGLR